MERLLILKTPREHKAIIYMVWLLDSIRETLSILSLDFCFIVVLVSALAKAGSTICKHKLDGTINDKWKMSRFDK